MAELVSLFTAASAWWNGTNTTPASHLFETSARATMVPLRPVISMILKGAMCAEERINVVAHNLQSGSTGYNLMKYSMGKNEYIPKIRRSL